MGIYSLQQRSEQTASWTKDGAKYTASYDVLCDMSDDHFTVLSNFVTVGTGVQPGSYYYGTYLDTINARMVHTEAANEYHGPLALWTIEVEYNTQTAEEREKAQQTEPISRTPVISYQSREVEKILEQNTSGTAILNSRGDEFNPAYTTRTGAGIISIKKNFAYPLPFNVDVYNWHTNAGTFLGYPAKSMLCVSIQCEQSATVIFETEYQYYECTFEFELDTVNYHQYKILDNGFYQNVQDPKYPSDPTKTIKEHCKDDFKKDVVETVALDGNGKQLADGATPAYIMGDQYYQADFSSLMGM